MLIGRDDVEKKLRSSLRRAREGAAAAVVVEGEAGLGKTQLLDAAGAWARELGVEAVRADCDEVDRLRPVGVLARALGVTRTGRGGGGRYVLIDRVLEELEERLRRAPLLLAVDDLQRADEDSLLTLASALRRLGDRPLSLVMATRPALTAPTVAAFLDTLRGGPAMDHVVLQPLDDGAVRRLIEERCQAAPDDALLSFARVAGGNPLYVTELLAALLEDGGIVLREGRAVLVQPTVPLTLRLTILRRLATLPAACLEALRTAAVLGVAFRVEHLALLTGSDIRRLGALLHPALRHGFLGEAGGGAMAFRHELVRTALYEDIPEPLRRAQHMDAARRLAAAHDDPVVVAEHVIAGAEPSDATAVRMLLDAAREVMAYSPGAAEQILRRARAVSPASAEIALALLNAQVARGRLDEVDATVDDLRALPLDRHAQRRLEVITAQAHLVAGRIGAAAAAVAPLSGGPVTEVPPLASAIGAIALLLGGDYAGAVEAARSAVALADAAGDEAAACAALVALSLATCYGGASRTGVEAARQAVDRGVGDPSGAGLRFQPHNALGLTLVMDGDFDAAVPVFRAGARHNESIGAPWSIPLYQGNLAMTHVLRGRIDDAEEEIAVARRVVEDLPESTVGMVPMLTWEAEVHLHRGRLDEARRVLDDAERLMFANGLEGGSIEPLMWTRGLLLEAEGRPAAGLPYVHGVWSALGQGAQVHRTRFLAADAVRMARAAGDTDVVEEVSDSVAGLLEAAPDPPTRAQALRCRGIADGDPGALREAVDLLRPTAWRLSLAWALEEQAGAWAGRDRRDEAIAALREALALWSEGGSVLGANRVRNGLRALGVRSGGRTPGERPASGWESLSRSELAVARLVATGMTNAAVAARLFVSRRTVETHLVHVYAKLGLASRTELVRDVVRRDALPG